MWGESWMEELPRELRSVWADALGTVPFNIWWANGERERTYTVASWLPERNRRLALCWYAALDPEPASERVTTAVTRAFRGVSVRERRWLVGVMPLGPVALTKLAHSRSNDYSARLMMRARQSGDVPLVPGRQDDEEERPLRNAWQAAHRKQSVSAAWAEVTETWRDDWQALGRLLLLPTREARAWHALPVELGDSWRAQAAFIAALSSLEEAEQVLAPAPKSLPSHCLAAVACADVPARWAELIRGAEDPSLAYEEGLYTSDERWTILAGKAACDRDRGMELDRVVMRVMIEAAKAPASWAVEVKRRLSGERDEKQIALQTSKIAKELSAPSPKKFKLTRMLSVMSEAGGRREAAPIVEELERRDLNTFRVERFAAGRSLKLLADDPEPDSETIAALAADGHLDEVRKHLPRLLESKPSAAALLDLARTIVLLEPGAAEAMSAELDAGQERLPGVNEAEARAWLSGSPDD